jgi:hypothetical protein
MHHSDPL